MISFSNLQVTESANSFSCLKGSKKDQKYLTTLIQGIPWVSTEIGFIVFFLFLISCDSSQLCGYILPNKTRLTVLLMFPIFWLYNFHLAKIKKGNTLTLKSKVVFVKNYWENVIKLLPSGWWACLINRFRRILKAPPANPRTYIYR